MERTPKKSLETPKDTSTITAGVSSSSPKSVTFKIRPHHSSAVTPMNRDEKTQKESVGQHDVVKVRVEFASKNVLNGGQANEIWIHGAGETIIGFQQGVEARDDAEKRPTLWLSWDFGVGWLLVFLVALYWKRRPEEFGIGSEHGDMSRLEEVLRLLRTQAIVMPLSSTAPVIQVESKPNMPKDMSTRATAEVKRVHFDEAVEGLRHSSPLNQSAGPDWSLVESRDQFGPWSTGGSSSPPIGSHGGARGPLLDPDHHHPPLLPRVEGDLRWLARGSLPLWLAALRKKWERRGGGNHPSSPPLLGRDCDEEDLLVALSLVFS
ncbi:hypothetical protein Sjap_006131 [Stephania japonica]|uniref:Uncharacterized protein n=1 Tax=Stephania japonica TaxID=461633 RepID=A0AAP0PIM1_9MAGN